MVESRVHRFGAVPSLGQAGTSPRIRSVATRHGDLDLCLEALLEGGRPEPLGPRPNGSGVESCLGGFEAPDRVRLLPEVLKFIQKMDQQKKLVAAICHGPWVLASAGLVEGVKTCGYDAVHDDLVNAGAEVLDVPAVRDGNIITGRVPDDLPEFCEEIVRALANEHPRGHRK